MVLFLSTALWLCNGAIAAKNVQPEILSCAIGAPPKKASLKESHALGVYTWPTRISGGYSGCQKVWLNDVNRTEIATVFYEKGRPVLLLERPSIDEDVWRICRYVSGVLAKDSSPGCQAKFEAF